MKQGGLYVAMGDSITWTAVDKGADLYAHRLWQYINATYGNIKFINKGIGGTTAAKMVTNLPWVLGSLTPDLVTIGVGMNDCTTTSGITTSSYKTNLGIVIDAIKQNNPDCVIVLCSPSITLDANRTNASAFRTAMSEVATSKNVGYCDFSTAWTTSNSDLKLYYPSYDIQSISYVSSTSLTVNATAHGLSAESAVTIRGSSFYNLIWNGNTKYPWVSNTSLTTNSFRAYDPAGSFSNNGTDTTSGMFGIKDVVHPNGAGHKKLFDVLKPIVETRAASWLNSIGTSI